MFKAPKFQMVELAIPATVTGNMQQTAFGQQPQLQSITGKYPVYIKAIEAYTSDMVAKSPLTPANPVASAADIANACLIINVAGVLDFNILPLAVLVRNFGTVATNVVDLFKFRNLSTIDWTKTTLLTIQAPITTPPFSYLFGVYYDYQPDYDDYVTGYQTLHQ